MWRPGTVGFLLLPLRISDFGDGIVRQALGVEFVLRQSLVIEATEASKPATYQFIHCDFQTTAGFASLLCLVGGDPTNEMRISF